jgi:hypothetical protein
MASTWYSCPTCKIGFDYTPNYEREFGHCGHRCLGCHTMMNWDEAEDSAGLLVCLHPSLKEPDSVLPIRQDKFLISKLQNLV